MSSTLRLFLTSLCLVQYPTSLQASSSRHSFVLFHLSKVVGRSIGPGSGSGDYRGTYRPSASSSSSSLHVQRKMTTILESPSAERNKSPIWEILSTKVMPVLLLPTTAKDNKDDTTTTTTTSTTLNVLEVAAGCGVHTEYFATQLRTNYDTIQTIWYPTDPERTSRDSIQGRTVELPNVKEPLCLTLNKDGIMEKDTSKELSNCEMDLMICINMIHISPWEATVGLMKLAAAKLRQGGILYCYGPYKVNDTAVPSNL